MPEHTITLGESFQEFQQAKLAEAKSSTVEWYFHLLLPFVEPRKAMQLQEVSQKDVRAFLINQRSKHTLYENTTREVQETGYSESTLRSMDTALRGFFSWLVREYDLAKNPMDYIRRPGEPHLEAKDISEEDFLKLALLLRDRKDPNSIRDHAIILLMMDAGQRSNVIRRVKVSDVDLDRRIIRFPADLKTGRTNVVPIDQVTVDALVRWLARRPEEAEGDVLFCGTAGLHYGKAMQQTALNQMLRRRAHTAGVSGHFNPHSFRHASAKRALENGANTAFVSQRLGHSNMNTTNKYYGQLAADKKREINDEVGALSKFKAVLKSDRPSS